MLGNRASTFLALIDGNVRVFLVGLCAPALLPLTHFDGFFYSRSHIFYALAMALHTKCRYPNEYHFRFSPADVKTSKIRRQEVPDQYVPWSTSFARYDPITFTAAYVMTASWADPKLSEFEFNPKWNELDGKVNRQSHEGKYTVRNNTPFCIAGRTGLSGRGILGRWGPNHAADTLLTRWKRFNDQIAVHPDSGKKILQVLTIRRKDNGEWALPGGMVDPGETVSAAVRREFMEETLDSSGSCSQEIANFFADSYIIYKGYVDDPRNTDNAWMETVVYWSHDDTGDLVDKLSFKAGSDAVEVQWHDVDASLQLYASHALFVQRAATKISCHW